jgi:hypothetical protein
MNRIPASISIIFHFRNADLPFVFWGVNNDATEYGYPYANVAGRVAVAPVAKLIYWPTHHIS